MLKSRGIALLWLLGLLACFGLLTPGVHAGEQANPAAGDVELGRLFSPSGSLVRLYISRAVDAHDRQGDLDGARDWLERALELEPENPVTLRMLQQVKAEQQQAGLQRAGVALGALQQMTEQMERHEEAKGQEEQQEVGQQPSGEPSPDQEPSAVDTSPEQTTPQGPVFGKGRAPVQTVPSSPGVADKPPALPTAQSPEVADPGVGAQTPSHGAGIMGGIRSALQSQPYRKPLAPLARGQIPIRPGEVEEVQEAGTPSWWDELDEHMKDVEAEENLSPGPMAGLENHVRCQVDVMGERVLQMHGQTILEGMRALGANDQQGAQRMFAASVRELSRFVQSLYCVDFDGLRYWDHAIARFWRGVAGKPAHEFNQAIIATWNPALVVVDAVQITGQSEIVRTFKELEPRIRPALQRYPKDSYGAAWLDDFGTGRLVRKPGQAAQDNLVGALSDPTLMGLGGCTLAAHADKADAGQPCLKGINLTRKGCSGKDLEELLGMLNDSGLMGLLLQAAGGGASQQGSGVPPGAKSGAPQQASYHGKPLQDLLLKLCEKLKNLKPKGLGKMLPKGRMGPGGCGFALATQGHTGPGGEWGGRVRTCIQKYSQQGPPPMEAVEVRFPAKKCGRGKPTLSIRIGKRKLYSDGLFLVNVSLENIQKIFPGGWISPWAGGQEYGAFLDKDNTSFRYSTDGELVAINQTKYNKDGSRTTKEETQWGTMNTRHYDKNGKLSYSSEETYDSNGDLKKKVERGYDKDGKPIKVTTTHGEGRPVGPGEGDCNESAAQKRARAIFNCIFSDTQVAPGGMPQPVTRPAGPTGPNIPPDCNEVDMASIWGSSTAVRGGAWDPEGPEDFLPAGPTTKGYIPKMEGVIDPPKESVAHKGKGKTKGGPPGSEDEPKGKDDD